MFFLLNKLTQSTFAYVIHICKAYASAVNYSYQEAILVHPTRRQIFAGKPDSTFHNIWDLLIYYQYPLTVLLPFNISGVNLCFFELLNWANNVLHVIFISVYYKTSPCLAWFDNTNKQFTNWCKPIWNYIWSTLQPLPLSLELRDASSSRRPIRVKYRLWRALQLDYAKIISRAEEIS